MLDSIEIKNFKRIQDIKNDDGSIVEKPLKLEKLAKINYLVGKNGSGKSSVLEAINDFYFLLPDEKTTTTAIPDPNIKSLSEQFPLNSRNGYKSIEGFAHPKISKIRDHTNHKGKIIINCKLELTIKTIVEYNPKLSNKKTPYRSFILYSSAAESYLQTPTTSLFAQILSKITQLGYEVLNKQKVWHEQIFNEDCWSQFGDIYRKHVEFYKIVNTADYLHATLKPNGEGYIYLAISGIKQKKLLEFLDYLFCEVKFLNIHSRSQGEMILKDIAIVVLDIQKRFKVNCFLIEEIETSLHPAWQKLLPRLLNYISENFNLQFIISTHSPFIISAAGEFSDTQKVYMIEDGQTVNLKGVLGKGTKGFPGNKCLTVASKMLGAGINDIHQENNIQEDLNIFYCEAKEDSIIYQTIFPEYKGRRNIFIGAGGGNIAVNAYHNGFLANEIIFGKSAKMYCLVDRSESKGGLKTNNGLIKTEGKSIFTDEERNDFLLTDENYRMLERREIENYLFDPVIIDKLGDLKLKKQLLELKLDCKKELKDKIKNIPDLHNLKVQLAKLIAVDSNNVYKELEKCIFG